MRIKGELFLLDASSWRAAKKHSAGRSLPTFGLFLALASSMIALFERSCSKRS